MFGATNIVKKSDKVVYNYYGIAFDGAVHGFGNKLVKNAVIFVVDNSSSSHADNPKNTFLVLGEGPSYCMTLWKLMDFMVWLFSP